MMFTTFVWKKFPLLIATLHKIFQRIPFCSKVQMGGVFYFSLFVCVQVTRKVGNIF